jgi:hypothetical protein
MPIYWIGGRFNKTEQYICQTRLSERKKMQLGNFYHSLLVWVEGRLKAQFWLWQVVFISVVVSLFLAFPPYTLLIDHFRSGGTTLDAWVFVEIQAHDLLHPKDIDIGVRRDNMIFRWMLPFLSFITGHNVLLILLLQAVLAIFFLYKIGDYLFRLSGDKVISSFFVFAIANTFVSVWAFADIHGYGDGFAYFLLLTALLARNPVLIFLALLGAFFTDERAVVAGCYLLLWWIVTNGWEKREFGFISILKGAFSGQNRMVWLAWVAYLGIRYYVRVNYFASHHYSTVGAPVLFSSEHRSGLGVSIWGVFEGMWLVIFAAFLIVYLSKRYLLFTALLVGLGVLITTGVFVHDIDRALAYGFPFLLISIFVIVKSESHSMVKKILFFAMVICVSHPQVFYMGYNKIIWLEPLPLKALMYLGQVFGWSTFR